MRPKKCSVQNFGSYKSLDFDFSNLGLTLISGATGSGKSTLMDIIPWTCWGFTSKDGVADDVRAWGSDECTSSTLEVELQDSTITICRIRGKSSQNDLYYVEELDPEKKIRGKDLSDTQKILNARLAVDPELFSLSVFFSQFSVSDQFFICKPKDRREILERISDLSVAVKLSERASEARKIAKKELEAAETEQARNQGRFEQLVAQKAGTERDSERWEAQQSRLIKETMAKSDGFEAEKAHKFAEIVAKLEALDIKILSEEDFEKDLTKIRSKRETLTKIRSEYQKLLPVVSDLKSRLAFAEKDLARQKKLPDVCPECNRPGANPNRHEHLAEAQRVVDDLAENMAAKNEETAALGAVLETEGTLSKAETKIRQEQADNQRLIASFDKEKAALEALDQTVNVHADRLAQMMKAENPYTSQVEKAGEEIAKAHATVALTEKAITAKTSRVSSLTQIYDLSFTLRGELLQNAVKELEGTTNANLETYFDGVFRVSYGLEDSDKLTVTIMKDGHEVNFKQLSGGERRQCVLSFWRALSKRAADTAGVSFSLAILDESFAGLDDDLKIKAFRMLEDMGNEFESVLVIEHSEAMKSCFDRKFVVEKHGDESIITEGEIGKRIEVDDR